MLVGDIVDTVMNLTTFAFVAGLVWILVRPRAPATAAKEKKQRKTS